MKKYLFTAIVTLLAIAMQAQNAEYVITGIIPAGAKTAYCYDNGQFRETDNATVSNDKFQPNGTKPPNTFTTVATDTNHSIIIINDHTSITISLNNQSITGSAQNVQLVSSQKQQSKQDEKMMDIYKKYQEIAADGTIEGQTRKATFEKQMGQLQEQQVQDILEFINTHKTSVAPAYLLGQMLYSLSYNDLVSILDNICAYYNHPTMEGARRQLVSLDKRRLGLQYTDPAMHDTQDESAKLSQWVGKDNYVLVDSWASWYGPCRQEMPNVVDAYKHYCAAEGFDVVGVPFNLKADAWKKGIANLQLSWHNISDLKGWRCAAAQVYGINSIPSNTLVDSPGQIVTHDLRGTKLADKPKEILGY